MISWSKRTWKHQQKQVWDLSRACQHNVIAICMNCRFHLSVFSLRQWRFRIFNLVLQFSSYKSHEISLLIQCFSYNFRLSILFVSLKIFCFNMILLYSEALHKYICPAWPSKQRWRPFVLNLHAAPCVFSVWGCLFTEGQAFVEENFLPDEIRQQIADLSFLCSLALSRCLSDPVRCWLAGTLVWNQWNSGWFAWFMTHSGLGLIRCTQASLSVAACVWMTIEDQQHYTPDFHPAFWTPQITSGLLIYGGHLE